MQTTAANKLLLLISLLSVLTFQQTNCDETQTGGLFSALMAPFKSPLNQVRRLLGGLANGEQGGSWKQRLSRLEANTFQMFARIYNKTYSAQEFPRRMRLFFERRKEIEASVRAYAEGRLPFMMRENAYADWDELEMKKLKGVAPPQTFAELLPEDRRAVETEAAAILPPGRTAARRFPRSILPDNHHMDLAAFYDQPWASKGPLVRANERIPATKDWRTSDCISAPINQMRCGACYAIATMSVIETMRCLRSTIAPILSPQHIVDCATPSAGYQNFGCDGGWPTRVLSYLQQTKVAVRDSCYPFVRRQQSCRLNQLQRTSPSCILNASPTNSELRYKVLNNERDILYHVAKTGPVVTVMRATDRFLYYGSGIFDDPSCSGRRDDVDHAIVIVGYGRENGQDYWLIKNSWGIREWGQMGYGKYRRGTNACSIGHWGWVITA